MKNVVKTPIFIVSYPSLHEPKLNKFNNKLEYSVVALFPKDADLKPLEAAIEACKVAKWGADKAKWPKKMADGPLRDQGEKEKEVDGKMVMPQGHVKGAKFMTLKNTKPVAVVGYDPKTPLPAEDCYPGMKAHAFIELYAYDSPVNKGVTAYLMGVQKVGDGESLTGRMKAEDLFSPIVESAAEDMFK
jgi:hypothetical protein